MCFARDHQSGAMLEKHLEGLLNYIIYHVTNVIRKNFKSKHQII